MTDKELIDSISKSFNVSSYIATDIIDSVLCDLVGMLVTHGEVKLGRYGTLKLRSYRHRLTSGRRAKVTFTVGPELARLLEAINPEIIGSA